MRAAFLFLVLSLICFSKVWAIPPSLKDAHVLFDSRDSRGGNGDVAASYHFAVYLLNDSSFQGTVTLIGDDASIDILGRLTGRSDFVNNPGFNGRLVFKTASQWNAQPKKVDVCLSLARASGDFAPGKNKVSADLVMNGTAYRVGQVVLGNTEGKANQQRFGVIQTGDLTWQIAAPGFSPVQSGRYADVTASALRGLGRDEIKTYLLQRLNPRQEPRIEWLMRYLNGNLLQGAELGFVYRIENWNTGYSKYNYFAQFETYLKGVLEEAQKGRSFILMTPTQLSEPTIEILRRDYPIIEIVTSPGSLPKQAERGKIYLVSEVPLENPIFNGFMAYSDLPPLVAGDSAVSAMIAIGKPFIATQVPWNEANIRNIKILLQKLSGENAALKNAFETVFGKIDLSPVTQMNSASFQQVYSRLDSVIPVYPAVLLKQIAMLQALQKGTISLGQALHSTSDKVLRISLIEKSFETATPQNAGAISQYLKDVLNSSYAENYADAFDIYAWAATLYVRYLNRWGSPMDARYFANLIDRNWETHIQRTQEMRRRTFDQFAQHYGSYRSLATALQEVRTPYLFEALKNVVTQDEGMRRSALTGIMNMGTPAAFAFVREWLEWQDPYANAHAAELILRFGDKHMNSEELTDLLIESFLSAPMSSNYQPQKLKKPVFEALSKRTNLTAWHRQALAEYAKGESALRSFLLAQPKASPTENLCRALFY